VSTRRKRKTTDDKGTQRGLHGEARSKRAAAGVLTMAALVFLAVAGPALAAEPDDDVASPEVTAARSMIEAVLALYEGVPSYAMDFTQENYWALADSILRTKGTILFKRPRNVSLTYEDGGRIVVREDSARVYVPATNQFFATRIDSTDMPFAPASLIRSFRIDNDAPFVSKPEAATGRVRTLNLVPAETWAGVSRMHATIDSGTNEVVLITIFATGGDWTTYTIHDSRFGVPTPADAFILTRPEGSELISN
jgi:outer membrane lipoprotein-sorting protein